MAIIVGRIVASGVRALGLAGASLARHGGGMGLLAWRSGVAVLRGEAARREFVRQTYAMGVESVPLVIATAILSGFVTSQQGGYQFTGAIPLYVLGGVVSTSVILELGPVMTAIVFIGRVGARITAELGTMVVSEQVDALYSLGRDPVAWLAAPRILAGGVTMPFLVGIADAVGVAGGMVSAGISAGLGPDNFLYGARLVWYNYNMLYSIMKAVAFGFLIPLVAVYMGLRTRGGAEGVGRATTGSVVTMITFVLVADAIFPPLFLN